MENQNPNPLNSQSTTMDASLSDPNTPSSETLTAESKPDPAAGSVGSPNDPKTTTGGDGGGDSTGEEEEEEEPECGFCLFMKGGGCKEPFVEWEKCVEDAERFGEDIAEKCFEITQKLRICMEAHSDYYEPLIRAEKSMMEEAAEEAAALEAEAGKRTETADTVQVVVVESALETESPKKTEAMT